MDEEQHDEEQASYGEVMPYEVAQHLARTIRSNGLPPMKRRTPEQEALLSATDHLLADLDSMFAN